MKTTRNIPLFNSNYFYKVEIKMHRINKMNCTTHSYHLLFFHHSTKYFCRTHNYTDTLPLSSIPSNFSNKIISLVTDIRQVLFHCFSSLNALLLPDCILHSTLTISYCFFINLPGILLHSRYLSFPFALTFLIKSFPW